MGNLIVPGGRGPQAEIDRLLNELEGTYRVLAELVRRAGGSVSIPSAIVDTTAAPGHLTISRDDRFRTVEIALTATEQR